MFWFWYVFSDMSEYEGAMLENNKEAILGTMWGNQMTFVYKQPPTWNATSCSEQIAKQGTEILTENKRC